MRERIRPYFDDARISLRHPVVRLGLGAGLVSVLLALVVGGALWWPVYREAESLRFKIDLTRRQAVERIYSAQLSQVYARTAEQISEIEKKLNTPAVQVSLLNHLNQLARKHGVRILSESYEEGKAQNGYAPLYHEITLEGRYPKLRSFLLDIGSLPTLSVVQEAALNRGGGARRSIKAQLRIVTYRKIDESAARPG